MKALRSAPYFRRQAGVVLILGGWLLQGMAGYSADLFAAKPKRALPAGKAPAAGASAPGGAAAASANTAAGAPRSTDAVIWADALPTARPAFPDLQLSLEEERKANAYAYFARGLIAEDGADAETALESYRKAFDLDPANVELAIKLAFLFAQRNDPPSGIQVLKDAVKASPKASMPLIYLSQLYAKYLKKPEQAMRYAEQALALDPNSYPAFLALYELQTAAGLQAKAELTLQQASRSASTDPQFWLQMGGLYARVNLKETNGQFPPNVVARANTFFRKAAELGKQDAVVQVKVGDYYGESKQVKEAIPYYRAALRLQPNSEDPVLLNAGDKLARCLAEIGRPAEAIGVLETLTRENPLRVESLELLGEIYEQTEDFAKALGAYQRVLVLDGTEARNHIRVAYMQMRQKRFAEAVETARQARARFADDPQTLYLLALALTQAKQHDEALAAYAEALHAFEEGHPELLNAEFYYAYGTAAEQAGLIDKAADLLRKSIELAPNHSAEVYNYLGYMWVDRGINLEEGGEMIKKALASEPENGAFMDSYGWYFYKRGEYDKALAQLLKAAENIKQNDPVVLEHIGDTYQQLGKTALALQYWQKSLALDGENKKIAEKVDAAKQKVSSAK